MNTKKRELEDWEKQECAALKAVIAERNAGRERSARLTQQKIADAAGLEQGTVSNYLNGRLALNVGIAKVLRDNFGIQPISYSQRIADEIKGLAGKEALDSQKHEVTIFGELDPWDDSTPLGPDEVELPLYREVELAAGDGRTQVIENGGAKLRFSRRTLSSAGVMKEHAACAYVSGNSMEPALMDGSVVGINKQDLQIRDGKVYAVDHEGMLRVKQVFRLPGGGIRLRSFNIDEFPDEEYGPGWPEYIRIIGRVFWSSTMW